MHELSQDAKQLRIALLAGVSFLGASILHAHESQPSPPPQTVKTAKKPPYKKATKRAPAEESASQGPHEAIKVHGHWTIEVRNLDGTIATHREFENSLAFGANTLAPILARTGTVGAWAVGVNVANATTNGGGMCLFNTTPIGCVITESSNQIFSVGQNVFRTLTVSAPPPPGSNPGAATLVLVGTFTVQNAAPIAEVSTSVLACAPTVAPADCPPLSGFVTGTSFFSDAAVTPIAVTVGQVVQLTVVFSFS